MNCRIAEHWGRLTAWSIDSRFNCIYGCFFQSPRPILLFFLLFSTDFSPKTIYFSKILPYLIKSPPMFIIWSWFVEEIATYIWYISSIFSFSISTVFTSKISINFCPSLCLQREQGMTSPKNLRNQTLDLNPLPMVLLFQRMLNSSIPSSAKSRLSHREQWCSLTLSTSTLLKFLEPIR